MQLLILLALLLYGGSGGKNLLNEVKPVLESFGGEEIKEALKSAEEISSVLSAVKGFSAVNAFAAEAAPQNFSSAGEGGAGRVDFPLAPINNVADKDIAYSLSKYIEG